MAYDSLGLSRTTTFEIAEVDGDAGKRGFIGLAILRPIVPINTEVILQRPCSRSRSIGARARVVSELPSLNAPRLVVQSSSGKRQRVSLDDVTDSFGRPISLTTVQIRLAQTFFPASKFDDAIESLAVAQRPSPGDDRVSTLRNEIVTLPLTLAEELAHGSDPADAATLLTYYLQVMAPRVRGTKDEGMLDASAALTQGYIEEASGHSARARERYRAAMDRYDAIGYRRRAGVAAYRLAVLTGEERHRAYVRDVVRGASPAYWLNERLANLGVHEIRLSERQADVLRLLVAGRSNKEIATIRGGSWCSQSASIVSFGYMHIAFKRKSSGVTTSMSYGASEVAGKSFTFALTIWFTPPRIAAGRTWRSFSSHVIDRIRSSYPVICQSSKCSRRALNRRRIRSSSPRFAMRYAVLLPEWPQSTARHKDRAERGGSNSPATG